MPNKIRTVWHGIVGGTCVLGAFSAMQLGLALLATLLSVVGIINVAIVVYDIKEKA